MSLLTRSASAAVVVLAVTVLPVPSARAASPTCEGHPATVVGAGFGTTLTGTDGPDVIVTNKASVVDALGGDDLICVTGDSEGSPEATQTIYAGAGNDTVDTTTGDAYSIVHLGSGSDTFRGGGAPDRVEAAGYEDSSETSDPPDTETDAINTGGGSDFVETGTSGLPDDDVVDIGRGSGSVVDFDGLVGHGSLAADGDSYRTYVDLDRTAADPAARWSIDDRHHVLASGEVSEPMTGFTAFVATATTSISMIGGPAGDYLAADAPSVDASMGGGGDEVVVEGSVRGAIVGGPGNDELEVTSPGKGAAGSAFADVVVDEPHGHLSDTSGSDLTIGSWENLSLSNFVHNHVVVQTGAAGHNGTYIEGCRAFVRGGTGRDTVDFSTSPHCPTTPAMTAYGEAGKDTLFGTRGTDRLVGGPGKDSVIGRGISASNSGRKDLCHAETVTSCELGQHP